MTLVELLVSMVIMGFVMTLVSQAVFQVGHIVRVADESVIRLGERWRGAWSLLSVMSNLVAPVEAGESPFLATAERFEAYSTVPLFGGGAGVHALSLLLRPDGGGGTEMVYQSGDSLLASGSPAAVLARFPGRVEFRFRTARGAEESQWPPLTRKGLDEILLPESVRLVEVGSGAVLMAYQVAASAERQLPPGLDPFSASAGK